MKIFLNIGFVTVQPTGPWSTAVVDCPKFLGSRPVSFSLDVYKYLFIYIDQLNKILIFYGNIKTHHASKDIILY